MKIVKYLGAALLALVGIYFLGPKVSYANIDWASNYVAPSLDVIDSIIAHDEAQVPQIKPDNEARIIWADSSKKEKTKYSMVYMHGFSASQEEGDPLHQEFAKRYGMNLYLTRLEDHGRADSNAFINFTPDALFESAQKALKIGEAIGDSVILMSCSNGGTMAVLLEQAPNRIKGHIMYSPNIDLFDPASELIVRPWGKSILKTVMGGEYNRISYKPEAIPYWNPTYHINGITSVKWTLENYMTPDRFQKFNKPTFIGYFRKSEEEQDKVVSVDAILDFYDKIATPTTQKRIQNFPEAGAHVISSYVFSKDYQSVQAATFKFADEVLGLVPVQ